MKRAGYKLVVLFNLCNPYTRVFRYLMLCFVFTKSIINIQAQTSNEYTIGVNSLGSYGFQYSHLSEHSKISFSYSTINNLSQFSSNPALFKANFTNQLNTLGMTYSRFKPLGQSFILYYGGKIDLATNPFKNQSLTIEKKPNYLHQIDLLLGLKYKINQNISIGAEFRQGYGNFLIFNQNDLFNSTFHNDWLNY